MKIKDPVTKIVSSNNIKYEKVNASVKIDGNIALNASDHVCKYRYDMKYGKRKYFCKMYRRKGSKCNSCAIEYPDRSVTLTGKDGDECSKHELNKNSTGIMDF